MFKNYLLTAVMFFFASAVFAQGNSWTEYFSNDDVKVSFKKRDCHYPEKGVHNQYVLLQIENTSSEDFTISFTLDRWYNQEKANPDVKEYSFEISANSSLSASCDDKMDGLHVYSKILTQEPKSVLSKFELSNIKINDTLVK